MLERKRNLNGLPKHVKDKPEGKARSETDPGGTGAENIWVCRVVPEKKLNNRNVTVCRMFSQPTLLLSVTIIADLRGSNRLAAAHFIEMRSRPGDMIISNWLKKCFTGALIDCLCGIRGGFMSACRLNMRYGGFH